MYHGDPAGQGVAATPGRVNTPFQKWASPALDGQIYGEPLVLAGRVYVATENDTVYALSATTGKVAWSRHLAAPVPASSLPCGDITPRVGITGTPVIDPARAEIFVVADEETRGRPAHVLAGLSTATGRVEMTRNVDPPGADTAALLQRTGLALAGGRVVFGFGGNDGDCATYRGRVVSVPEAGGRPAMFTVDAKPGESQGAVWMGGAAPAVDAAGHVWVTVGNGSVYKASRGFDDSDSVLDLSPSMKLLQYFAPGDWAVNNSRDLDMSAEPALLPGGQVLIAGKAGIAYLLDGAHLGGIGGELASTQPVCGANIDGGAAVAGSTVYLPCVERDPGGPRGRVTAGPAAAVEFRDRRRPADRGRGPGLDDQPGRLAVRSRPADREGAAAGSRRHRREPLPHPQRGSRPAAGPGREPGRHVPGHGRPGPGPASPAPASPPPPGRPPRGPCRARTLPRRPCPVAPSRASWRAAWRCWPGSAGWCGAGGRTSPRGRRSLPRAAGSPRTGRPRSRASRSISSTSSAAARRTRRLCAVRSRGRVTSSRVRRPARATPTISRTITTTKITTASVMVKLCDAEAAPAHALTRLIPDVIVPPPDPPSQLRCSAATPRASSGRCSLV